MRFYNWPSLCCSTNNLQEEKTRVLESLLNGNIYALESASDALKQNREFILSAVQKNGNALRYTSERLRLEFKFKKAEQVQHQKALMRKFLAYNQLNFHNNVYFNFFIVNYQKSACYFFFIF